MPICSQGTYVAVHSVTACTPCIFATRVLSACTSSAWGQGHASEASPTMTALDCNLPCLTTARSALAVFRLGSARALYGVESPSAATPIPTGGEGKKDRRRDRLDTDHHAVAQQIFETGRKQSPDARLYDGRAGLQRLESRPRRNLEYPVFPWRRKIRAAANYFRAIPSRVTSLRLSSRTLRK